MISYHDLELNNLQLNMVSSFDKRSKAVKQYYNIECGFDIETSSVTLDGDEKLAFMYEWTFGISDKEHICYGRTWEEFLEFCQFLQDELGLDENNILVVYIHNMGYEFQFMRKYFNWLNVFAVDDRKPIRALSSFGIEFRDSYILSGYSLAKLADNLVSHDIKKLAGDLDYKLCRLPDTPLSQKELAYCNNDVEIILYYINEQIEQYGNITKIPMTNTGRVRKFVRDKCYHTNKTHKKDSRGKNQRYKELMEELVLTKDEYIKLKNCFMGGFTHASMLHSGKLLENVSSIDFTSSYPAVMLSEKFPMSKPKHENLKEISFSDLMADSEKGLMFDVRFNNLHSKLSHETYLSESKCIGLEKPIINNGRVFSADVAITTMTDIDFRIMQKCYTWDSVQVSNCYSFYMSYLPRPIILAICELYGNKTTLKGVKGKEVEYLVSKGMLNSVYGMCVTDIVRNTIEYTDSWHITPFTEDDIIEQVEKYNSSRNRFLYYPWGVWVTAYARRNLWTGILNIGDDYVYSDTDSIKMLNYEKHLPYINWYNQMIENKLKAMCEARNIDFALMKPKTIKGVEKLIGVWDYEGTYTHFKTLGAKRYLVRHDDGSMEITVAGLSKQRGVEYLLEICDNDYNKVFDMFNDDLFIPASETGKNTHTYIDDEMTAEVTDYKGHSATVTALSGVHLSECEFTLSISRQYSKFLENLRSGYIFAGAKNV